MVSDRDRIVYDKGIRGLSKEIEGLDIVRDIDRIE